MPNPLSDARPRILRVLNVILNGDMIEVYAAYRAMFPRSWEQELSQDEHVYIPSIVARSEELYGKV